MSNTYYDSRFLSIPFYKTHPYMMPFVGRDYESSKHKKFCLLARAFICPKVLRCITMQIRGMVLPYLRVMSWIGATLVGLVRARVVALEKKSIAA